MIAMLEIPSSATSCLETLGTETLMRGGIWETSHRASSLTVTIKSRSACALTVVQGVC